VIQSAEEAKKLVTGEVGKEITANTVRDAGVRIVGWTFTGFPRIDQLQETRQNAG
jgi:TRAP-type C4-dicarboxylate transport system substrate-binding protein